MADASSKGHHFLSGTVAFTAMSLVAVAVVASSAPGMHDSLRGQVALTPFGGGSMPPRSNAYPWYYTPNATGNFVPPYSMIGTGAPSSTGNFVPPYSMTSSAPSSTGNFVPPYSMTSSAPSSTGNFVPPYSMTSSAPSSTGNFVPPYSSSSNTPSSTGNFVPPYSSSSNTPSSTGNFVPPYSSSSNTPSSTGNFVPPYSSSSNTPSSTGNFVPPYSSPYMSSSADMAASASAAAMSAFQSSMNAAVIAAVPQELILQAADVINAMTGPPADLAVRLTETLTLTPPVALQVFQFIAYELPVVPVTPMVAATVYRDFKIDNGERLKAQGLTPAPDVDPKDWYAPVVVEVQMAGIMTGNPLTGHFEPEREMNQAEFAKTLANTVATVEGTPFHAAAPVNKAFDSWPGWARNAVQTLRLYDIPTTFFRANAAEPITRLQLAQGITQAFFPDTPVNLTTVKYFKDITDVPEQYRDTLRTVSSLGIMTGDAETGNFEPLRTANRAEVAKVFATALKVKALQMQTADAE